MGNKEIREDRYVKFYQTLTVVFAFLFLVTMIFYTIPNYKQSGLDRECRSLGLQYAKVDVLRGEYSCCRMSIVSDWENNITYWKEGCSSPFDVPTIKDGN